MIKNVRLVLEQLLIVHLVIKILSENLKIKTNVFVFKDISKIMLVDIVLLKLQIVKMVNSLMVFQVVLIVIILVKLVKIYKHAHHVIVTI